MNEYQMETSKSSKYVVYLLTITKLSIYGKILGYGRGQSELSKVRKPLTGSSMSRNRFRMEVDFVLRKVGVIQGSYNVFWREEK